MFSVSYDLNLFTYIYIYIYKIILIGEVFKNVLYFYPIIRLISSFF